MSGKMALERPRKNGVKKITGQAVKNATVFEPFGA